MLRKHFMMSGLEKPDYIITYYADLQVPFIGGEETKNLTMWETGDESEPLAEFKVVSDTYSNGYGEWGIKTSNPTAYYGLILDLDHNTYYADSGNTDSITGIIFSDELETISGKLFVNPSTITDITLSKSLKHLGKNVFSDTKVKNVVIPGNVTQIDQACFTNCNTLESITINSNFSIVNTQGKSLFEDSANTLTSISIGTGSVTKLPDYFCKNLIGLTSTIKSNYVTSYGISCYENTGISDVHFNNNTAITVIPKTCFKNCLNLTNVHIPTQITDIHENAFLGCVNLNTVVCDAELPPNIHASDIFGTFTDIPNLQIQVYALENYTHDNDWKKYSNVTKLHPNVIQYNAESPTKSSDIKSIYSNTYYMLAKSSYFDILFNNTTTQIIFPNFIKTLKGSCSNCGNLINVVLPLSCEELLYMTKDNYGLLKYGCFESCSKLQSIELPDTLKIIDAYCFRGCTSLTNVNWGKNVSTIGTEAFILCKSLTNVHVGQNVSTIGTDAFRHCVNIEDITVDPNNVTFDSRDNCNALINTKSNTVLYATKHSVIPEGVTSIAYKAFLSISDTLIIPESMKTLPITLLDDLATSFNVEHVIYNAINCTIPNENRYSDNMLYPFVDTIKTFTIGPNVQYIPTYLCPALLNVTSIEIPETVVNIGDKAFCDCYFTSSNFINKSSAAGYPWGAIILDGEETDGVIIDGTKLLLSRPYIQNLIVPSGITYILGSRLMGSDMTVTIPSSVTEIHTSWASDNMSKIIYLGTLAQWFAIKNLNTYSGNPLTVNAEFYINGLLLTHLEPTADISNIPDYIFRSYNHLQSIHIPSTITSIGQSAFSGCGSLNTIVLEEGVLNIGASAFSQTAISEITLPNSITLIGKNCFSGCRNLTKAYNISKCSAEMFYTCDRLTTIELTQNVLSIGMDAFWKCSALSAITIPNSVSTINSGAFRLCTSLKSITYTGTIEQWNAITKGSNWKYSVPPTCVVHCTDGDIPIADA